MDLVNITEESLEMDQELAQKLFKEGGCLIVMGVPIGTEFGIDSKSWETGEKFMGVKMIPPGLHFIYYSGISKHGDTAPRAGFMHFFNKSEVLVRRWDDEKEEISVEELPQETVERLRSAKENLDPYLGVYPYDTYRTWVKLTTHLSEKMVAQLVPLTGQIRSAVEYTAQPAREQRKRRSRPSTAEEKEDDLLPQLSPIPGTELRLTAYPTNSYPDGASPQEITRHSIDPTYTLNTLLSTYKKPMDFLAELQFSFVCFLVGHCIEALEQWKTLVRLVCRCHSAVCHRPLLYSLLLDVLETHIDEVPQDFLADIVASENVIYRSLRELFCTIQTTVEVDGRLRSKADRFQKRLTEKFEWDFDNLDKEEDDEAPVVVML